MTPSILKKPLVNLHWLMSSQLGFDLVRLSRSLRGLPQFFKDWRRFRNGYAGAMDLMPCLHDRYEEGGATRGEYFWQDLLVARWVHAANPRRHVDVGSRVDGFVAHVASFRDIEIFDVRPISTPVPGVIAHQADLTRAEELPSVVGYCDSLSCLHALEHFGLGRYGDLVDPAGHRRGLGNMARLLESGGTFYLSTPIGRERVAFNAHRVFDPRSLVALAAEHGLALTRLAVVHQGGTVKEGIIDDTLLGDLAAQAYNLGIFVFIKRPGAIGN